MTHLFGAPVTRNLFRAASKGGQAALLFMLGCSAGSSPVAPAGTILTIAANPSTIAVTGSSTISVTAIDPSGVPARSGTEISLTTTLGRVDPQIRTDSTGVAHGTLQADGHAGTATVRATSGVVGTASPVTVSVIIGAATPQMLKASFTSTVGESLTVVFTDTSTGNPTGWNWQFGDGGTSMNRDPAHTYAAAGSYVVTLLVTNPDGQDTFSQALVVPASQSMPPAAAFTFAVTGLQATFTDGSTNKPTSWTWDFGDGQGSTTENPIHVFGKAGIYPVALTARNAAGSSTVSKGVEVPSAQIPVASFAFVEVDKLRVLFRDTSMNQPTAWAWSFGDGGVSSVPDPDHTYASTGTYTVSLTATNLAGASTATQFVTVRGPLVAAFAVTSSGLTISCTDQSLGSPTTFQWTFGDGTPAVMNENPSHQYSAPGHYVITLIVTRPASAGSGTDQSTATTAIDVSGS